MYQIKGIDRKRFLWTLTGVLLWPYIGCSSSGGGGGGSTNPTPAEPVPGEIPEGPVIFNVPNPHFGVVNFPVNEVSVNLLRELGVGWVRVNVKWEDLETYPGNFYKIREFKDKLRLISDHGIKIYLTVVTRNHWYKTPNVSPAVWNLFPHAGGRPTNPSAYRTFLMQLITGLQGVVEVFQIDNEVAPFGSYWQDTYENYLWLFQAVANEGFSCKLIPAGIASGALEQALAGNQYAIELLESLLNLACFDAVDVHLYHATSSIPYKIDWVRQRTNAPIIATEVSGPDISIGAEWSEEAKCVNVEQRMQMLYGLDIRAGWFSMYDLPGEVFRFSRQGLIGTDGVKHPAFDIYREFIEQHR